MVNVVRKGLPMKGLSSVRVRLASALKPHVAPLLAALLSVVAWLVPAVPAAQAGPVEWHEVAASSEGRQWWDAGSLRLTKGGNLSVLSRFQAAPPEGDTSQRPSLGDLYVMEIDCGQKLYRDTSVNGIPQLRAEWHPAGSDALIDEVIEEACAAGQDLLA